MRITWSVTVGDVRIMWIRGLGLGVQTLNFREDNSSDLEARENDDDMDPFFVCVFIIRDKARTEGNT